MKKYYEQENENVESISLEETVNIYDLEERTFLNAKRVQKFIKKVEQSIWNIEYIKQVVRSSGSVGANYIESNEFPGEKDFLMKARIAGREAKETKYWLCLMDIEDKPELETERKELVSENEELRKILSSIINNRIKNQTLTKN
ncbi:MAG: four helix bundle protein [Bacteroidetes bacterium]|nr:four helix bundle protein [Bacteroidota bacterium]